MATDVLTTETAQAAVNVSSRASHVAERVTGTVSEVMWTVLRVPQWRLVLIRHLLKNGANRVGVGRRG